MSKDNNHNQQEPAENPGAQDEIHPGNQAQAQQAQEPTNEQKLQQEKDELEQKLLRISADYQNFMRRSRNEIEAAKQQQIMSIARQLVTVLDNFDHALEANTETTSSQQLLKGIMMVRDELISALDNVGVKRINAEVGDVFDPNFHEAMMRQESDDIEQNHITAQLQPGYALGDKAIRPVKVAVAQ